VALASGLVAVAPRLVALGRRRFMALERCRLVAVERRRFLALGLTFRGRGGRLLDS
jgi:hypothetical protein